LIAGILNWALAPIAGTHLAIYKGNWPQSKILG